MGIWGWLIQDLWHYTNNKNQHYIIIPTHSYIHTYSYIATYTLVRIYINNIVH